MEKKYRLCRKNQLFYNREHTLNYLQESCKGNELTFIENILLWGLLYKLNGYIRRHLQLTKKSEVVDYFIKTFNSEYRGNRIMHKYIDDLLFIKDLYDD